ncbi:hypothetical protein FGG08_006258 [Glutinoglossum americanum]|uniref:Phosphoribosylaminoimidazole carboxylase n=1 Tax=Glutinoglossum americanum TaxID=1670608 RepID=A0A9P8I1X8_9PEZI|nr:hypothetical protein FGG08_006258 [Glutinoglossum americanum]
MDNRTIGILGGGQLGRMLTEAAHRMNLKIAILDSEDAPAKQINARNPHVCGSFTDPSAVRELARQCDILTVEIEHVNTEVLEEIAELGVEVTQDGRVTRRKVKVQPNWRTIRIIQDKYLQKQHLHSLGVSTAESVALSSNSAEAVADAGRTLGYPLMLKSRIQAYDGRGNFPVRSPSDIPTALQALGERPLYAEKWIEFAREVAVMVVKTENGSSGGDDDAWKRNTLAYPVVETIHEDSICKLVYAPSLHTPPVSAQYTRDAEAMARRAVAGFWGMGIFGVEMFLTDKSELLINEIAPRPHNSGHYTIEACQVSQYDAHLRAILELPFPSGSSDGGSAVLQSAWSPAIRLKSNIAAVMLNILGGSRPDSHIPICRKALETQGATLHLYGKDKSRPGRKMGHITVIAETPHGAQKLVEPLIHMADHVKSECRRQPPEAEAPSQRPVEPATVFPSYEASLVAITMGSDSDLPVLKPGISLLRDLDIPCYITITSAHRTPNRMFTFAQEAASRGIRVIIAAAGGAAHLPGMIAACTPLPVIGVPRGVPVATVAINNSTNAALLAARILGTYDETIRERVRKYAQDMENGVLEKADRLDEQGWEKYVVQK